MPHILIVEDEAAIADTLIFALQGEGFTTTWLSLGAAALEHQRQTPADLIILDIGLPDISGFETCKQLRRFSEVPVIFLSARDAEIDRVVGLEIGADDYVVKPFEPRELVARIRSVLRRASRGGTVPDNDASYEFDGWLLDPLKRRLVDPEGTLVPISSAEFRLLTAFLDHPRQVLDRDRLLDMVQGREAHLFDRAVDNQVSRLRRKMETDNREPRLIQTVWGGGYRLASDVRRTMSAPD